MKTIFTLMFAVVLSGLSLGQYLSFKEFKGLLDVAGSETKVGKYLKDRGFEKNGDDKLDNELGIKSLLYKKKISKRDYFVTVVKSVNGSDHQVREFSKDKKRWSYYQEVTSSNGFKEIESKSSGNSLIYRNAEFELRMEKSQGLDGTYYAIRLSRV